MTKSTPQSAQAERRVAVWVTQDEVEAFLAILLNAPESPHVSSDVTEDLLVRVAEARREFTRLEHAASASGAGTRTVSRTGS